MKTKETRIWKGLEKCERERLERHPGNSDRCMSKKLWDRLSFQLCV